ncbi:MAG: hypothetical protein LAT84_00290 [Balneolia bacterium]|nr:hypothetical protein [Balneolia bacterium]
MKLSSYTLLIVESGVIARAIRALEIPGLEVMATSGYAWFPQIHPETGRLVAKANPSQLDFRKELKNKAQYAIRIIIAADSDPSGKFIQNAIFRFLKKDDRVFTANLTAVGTDSVNRMIESASRISESQTTALERYFRCRGVLSDVVRKKVGSKYTLAEILAVSVLMSENHFTTFSGVNSGKLYSSLAPVCCEANEDIKASALVGNTHQLKDQRFWLPIRKPASTAFLMPSAAGSYADSQDILNRLFGYFDPELGFGLISYPRTSANGYYHETWEKLSGQVQKTEGADAVLTPALRSIHPAAQGHESLHVTDTNLEPNQLRPFLRRDLFDMYRTLYRITMSSIRPPSETSAEYMLKSDSGATFFSPEQSEPLEDSVLKPILTTEQFMEALLDTFWVKASSIGKTMDRIAGSHLFCLSNDPVPNISLNTCNELNLLREFSFKTGQVAERLRESLELSKNEFGSTFRECSRELNALSF